jgi:signal transduction histidine kinase
MAVVESDAIRDTPVPITTRTLRRERVKVSQHVAAAIAHELRNPVFAIASAAQLLRYRVSDDPLIEKNIGRILREAERLNTLVTTLLEYGRPAPVRLAPGDPDEVWTDVLEAQRGLLESKALLVRHAPASPRAICEIDAEQLAQAYSSVLANAIEAAPEGSDLTIESASGDGEWSSRLHNPGPSVAPDVLPHVFEPLVTAKPGHTGIGLAVAHRVVSEHGGTITIESENGRGTTVTFSLKLGAEGRRV